MSSSMMFTLRFVHASSRYLRTIALFSSADIRLLLLLYERLASQGGGKPGPYPIRGVVALRSRVGAGLAPALGPPPWHPNFMPSSFEPLSLIPTILLLCC